MANFTHSTNQRENLLFLYLKPAVLLAFFISSFLVSNAQVTDIYTDYNGFWHSNVDAFSSTLPTKNHNVVGFKFGGTTFSTGVNNSLLTSQGITYTPGVYKTLPFNTIGGTIPSNNSKILLALAEQIDGVTGGYSNPLPSIKVKDALVDGINGLNIGTGVTNLPSSADMTFPAQIISTIAINDNQPDIIFAQMTDAATSADVLVFKDSEGHTVGNTNSIQWNLVKNLGEHYVDLYNLTPGALVDNASIVSGNSNKTTQSLRLAAFKLSDFGITAANAASVATFVIKPAGSSDPAFIAYNTEAIRMTPPTITTQPQSKAVCAGTNQSATFSVVVTGLEATYQWMKNGVNIPGATGTSYTIPAVTDADAGTYQVVVTNNGGSVTSENAYLNTVILRQPSPSSQTIVTGNTVTFSVSATNTTSFQWRKNGIDIAGAIDSVYVMNPLTVAHEGTYTVVAVNSASGGCASVVSNPVSVTPVIVVYSKSTGDINIPATWGANTDGSGSTPVNFTRAEHTFVLSNRASGNTQTDLTIAGTLDVKDGVAIIANQTTLDVGRAIRTGSGSIAGTSTSNLTVRGNSDLFFTNGSQILKEFTITGGTVNMLSPLTISGGSVLPGKLNLTGGTLNLGSNIITLSSTSLTNTSMVTAVGAGASITYGVGGAFLVERFIPGKRAFRMMSPAVTTTTSIKRNWMEGINNTDRWNNINPIPGYGTHITGSSNPLDSVDATQTFNPSLYTFDNINQRWITVYNSHATLVAGSPYRLMVRGSRSVDLNNNEATPSNTIIRATGKLTTGTVIVGSNMLSPNVGGFAFVGNPYASPIDFTSLTKTGLSNTYYEWDPTLNRRGSYVTYNGTAETNSNSLSDIDENIQSGQGFFVHTRALNPTLQFKETNKTANNTTVFRGSGQLTKLSVQLLLNQEGGNQNAADALTAVFRDDFYKEIGDEDSYKFTNLDESLAIDRNGTALSIEGRPLITGTDTLPLKVWQLRQKAYWLKVEASNFSSLVNAFLRDEYLGREIPLSLSSSTLVPFNITDDVTSSAPNRFSIVFETYSTLPVLISGVKAYQKEKGIQVTWNIKTETNVDYYEVEKSIDGQQFEKASLTPSKGNSTVSQSYDWFDNNPNSSTNFYRIKITEKSGAIHYSSVVSVNLSKANSSFSIFPNPVKGSDIGIKLSDMQKGKYSVNLYNTAGQKMYETILNHRGGSAYQTISLNQKPASGKYTLQLGNGTTVLTQAVIVQQ